MFSFHSMQIFSSDLDSMLLRRCKVEKDPTDKVISEEGSSSDDSTDGNYEPPGLQPVAKRIPARKECTQYKPISAEADCYLYRSADDPDLKTKLAYTNGPCFDVITVQRNRKLATADVVRILPFFYLFIYPIIIYW